MSDTKASEWLIRHIEHIERRRGLPDATEVPAPKRWCFPQDLSSVNHPLVQAYFERSTQTPGEVLLAAYVPQQNAGQLYALQYEGKATRLQVHEETLTAWLNARAAVPRSLPYFLPHPDWGRMHTLPSMRPAGNSYGADPRSNQEARFMKRPVDGASFGLAFALSIASRLLNEALPDDLVALARCDPQGKLGSVGGLDAKLHAIRLDAPRIRRVVLSKDQELPTDATLLERFDFLQRETLEQTLTKDVYDRTKMQAILEKHIRSTPLSEQVEALLDFVLFEPTPNTYRPYIKTCELLADILKRGDGHEAPATYLQLDAKLRYCIARTRNKGGEGSKDDTMPAPEIWVRDQPRWLRRKLMAGYAQYTYGHTAFEPQEMLDLLESEALDLALDLNVEQTSSDELVLLGARTRLLEHVGRYKEALDTHTRIAAQWSRRRHFDQATWSLSRAIVLAGLLQDETTLNQLKTLTHRVLLYLPRPDDGRTFLHLAWYRTEVFREHMRSQHIHPDKAASTPLGHDNEPSLSIQWLQAELNATRLHEHVLHGFDRFALLAKVADSTARKRRLSEAKDPIYPLLYAITDAYLQGDEKAMERARATFRAQDIIARRLEASFTRSDVFSHLERSSVTEQTRIVLFLYPY